MNGKLSRGNLGLAAEYAVASELCRRGIYAGLTLGNQKRVDLLVFEESGGIARIEVKAKQGPGWPNCRGIAGGNVFLVFVDYAQSRVMERPDFYVLSATDWRQVLEKRVDEIREKKPWIQVTITAENVAIFDGQISATGKPYQGMGIRPSDVTEYRERWHTIQRAIGAG